MTKEAIIKAYCKIREIDCSIPDDVLDFMKESSIRQLEMNNSCSGCQHKEYSPMFNNCNNPDTDDGWSCKSFYSIMPNFFKSKDKNEIL